jgi:Gas vesicle synthesis protein GvpO
LEALMATKREEAQKRRAEGRQKRRGNAPKAPEEPKQEETSGEEPLDTVKHAAKVAAAAAAVGAAVGAARAMTGGAEDGDEPERAPEPESEQEQAPEPEPEPEQPEQPEEPEPRAEHPRAEQEEPHEERSGAKPSEARSVVEAAREQLAALLGKDADSVSGLDRNGDGWLVTLEVVEVARIPESTDVLASYEVELDGDRNLVRYVRRRRYYRSQADDGELS